MICATIFVVIVIEFFLSLAIHNIDGLTFKAWIEFHLFLGALILGSGTMIFVTNWIYHHCPW